MSESVWKRIEESRARHNVLEHPFYVRWSAGELSSEELARYSGQYRHATEALAKLTRRHGRAGAGCPPRRDRAPRRRGAGAHRRSGTTSSRPPAARSAPSRLPRPPSASQTWTARTGYLSALARLYAIESGQPEISRIKREGLAEFYGIDGGAGAEYFRVHETMDEAHAAESRRLIDEAMSSEDEDAVVAAAESAFVANLAAARRRQLNRLRRTRA